MNPLNVYNTHAFEPNPLALRNYSLGDKTTDAGLLVPNGRVDDFWKNVKIRPAAVGLTETPNLPHFRVPNLTLQRFNLRSIEFGNYVNEQRRQEMLYGSAASMRDLSRILDCEESLIGLNGFLGLALGARGRGGHVLAHYEPRPFSIINLTRDKGKGSFAHEYAHAVDNMLSYYTGCIDYCSGSGSVFQKPEKKQKPNRKRTKKADPNAETRVDDCATGDCGTSTDPEAQKKSFQEKFSRVFEAVLFDEKGKPTEFHDRLSTIVDFPKYYKSRTETWARVFEAWTAHELYRTTEEKDTNTFLCKEVSFYNSKHDRYPSKKDLERASPAIRELMDAAMDLFRQEAPKPELEKFQTGSRATTVQTQDEELAAEYVLTELDNLVASHNPKSFSANPEYPAKCQQRTYHTDPAEQLKVSNGAKNFKPEFVINTAPTATDGTPICTRWGTKEKYIVLGGNGRTMMMLMLRDIGNYHLYVDFLKRNIHLFGYAIEDVDKLTSPVLIRTIKADADRCAYFSNVLNKGFTQSIDTNTEAVSLARQITPEVMEEIAAIMQESESETMAELWRNTKAERAVVSVLRRARIITTQNTSTFLSRDGAIDDKGKLIIERVFLAAILEDVESIEAARNYSGHILRVAPLLLQLKRYSGEWNLITKIREAIRYEYERRASGMTKKDFISQITFDRPDGIHGTVVDVWDVMDSGSWRFAAFVTAFVQAAAAENNASEAMAFVDPLSADDVIKRLASGAGLSDVPIPTIDLPPAENQDTSGDTMYASGKKSTPDPVSVPMIASARDIRSVRYRPISLYHMQDFLGTNVPPNFDMVIWGDMYQGKSSFTTLLADDLAINGRVLLNQAEEDPSSGSFRERLEKTGATLRGVDVVHTQDLAQLEKLLESGAYKFVIIDSVQRMTRARQGATSSQLENELLTWFIRNQGKYGIVLVARKDKYLRTAAGKNDWLFDANIVVKVEGGRAVMLKNRYMDPREIAKKKYIIWK